MIRFFVPALLITVVAWVFLYGLKPRLRPVVWGYARHALFALSIGVAVVLSFLIAFSLLEGVHHG